MDEEKSLSKGPPLVLLPPVYWRALSGAIVLAALVIGWAFFGSLPLQVEGEGAVFNPDKLFMVQAAQNGTVNRVLAKWGETVEKGQEIIDLFLPDARILAESQGSVLEILVEPGQDVYAGQVLMWLQRALGETEVLHVAGVVPSPADSEILAGMEVEVALEMVHKGIYGQLVGKVEKVIPFWTADRKSLFPFSGFFSKGGKSFQNLVIISLTKNASTYSGYQWTTDDGAPIKIVPGTPCKFVVTVSNKKPIAFVLNRMLERNLRPSRGEVAELSNLGDAKQSHHNREESPSSRKEFFK